MASHKTLQSVVRSLAESFASLMNYGAYDYIMGHIVLAAWSSGARDLRVDLLTGATDPSALLTPPVRASIAGYVERLPELVRCSNSDLAFVVEAELRVTVDPTTRRPRGYGKHDESPFTCTVRIVDDRGKVYAHRIQDWWFPERALPAKPERALPAKQEGRWWQFWKRRRGR